MRRTPPRRGRTVVEVVARGDADGDGDDGDEA
jgi:hypothetical protein